MLLHYKLSFEGGKTIKNAKCNFLWTSFMTICIQVAIRFAELHDTAERMLEKGCIFDIVPWRNSRRILYWRLRRLLRQNLQEKRVQNATGPDTIDQRAAAATLRRWFTEDRGETQVNKYFIQYKVIRIQKMFSRSGHNSQ